MTTRVSEEQQGAPAPVVGAHRGLQLSTVTKGCGMTSKRSGLLTKKFSAPKWPVAKQPARVALPKSSMLKALERIDTACEGLVIVYEERGVRDDLTRPVRSLREA